MVKNIAKYQSLRGEYWNLIISSLSSYEVKDIADDGIVTRRRVKDDYFLVNDVWNVEVIGEIPDFKQHYKNYKGTNRNIAFETKNSSLALELKFVFFNKLFNDEWYLSTIFTGYKSSLNRLIEFLNEKYPRLNSFLDFEVDKAEKEWIWWLNNKGVNTIQTDNNLKFADYEGKTNIANFLRKMYENLFNLIDTREEWEKDKWDIRVINEKYGISYNPSNSHFYLDFSKVQNVEFKYYLKEYIKTRLLGGKSFSFGTARTYLFYVPNFLNFITDIEPNWSDLIGLSRHHIEKYLEHLHQHAKGKIRRKDSNPKQYISNNLKCVYTFLRDIQRFEYCIAPEKSSSKLLYSDDYPTLDKKSDDDIDYIPDYVLEQLFENLNDLHPDLQPVIWAAFKTGLRISDTLGLTQGCLIPLNGKYSIVTDIEKTYVKGHKIPIDEHLAGIIAVLIDLSKQNSNDDNNPEKYIFVRYRGSRKGKPFGQGWVQNKLNELAIKKNITDEFGNIYHFKMHQFRHTYGIKLLNGGADILTVQELMAHASPEMTMRYARLLDDTKRKEFEKVVKQGVFSFDLNGEIHQVSETEEIPEDILDMIWKDEKLNAIDNPYGTCRARVNGNCPLAAEPPCLTANDGKPCFDLAVGMTSFDIKKYELHIESTTKIIEASKEYGRQDMIETNEKNLKRYQDIYETIKNGNVIFGRFERMKRQLEGKKRKGVKRG